MAKKVVLGMSGGVDSSVCAYLLQKHGYEVEGLFMRNWDSFLNNDFLGNSKLNDEICPQEQDYIDAKNVANKFDIKLHRIDFVKEYWDNVFSYLINEYSIGRTPNPDIFCNKYIKFSAFANYAFNQLNADYIAMGHYAKVENEELFRAFDASKDQTYFLAQLSNKQLSKTLFPLHNLTKKEVREIAKQLNLDTANKKDSTGICFIGERNFTKFLENYIPAQPGDIIDINTKEVVGKHIGAMYYTIGQRKGLNLGGFKKPYFVVGHDIAKKVIYVANEDHKDYLLSDSLIATDWNQIAKTYNKNNLSAKFRYRQEDIKCSIEILENSQIKVDYNETQAVTPGQAVVIYDGNKVVGGGIINEVFYKKIKKNYL